MTVLFYILATYLKEEFEEICGYTVLASITILPM